MSDGRNEKSLGGEKALQGQPKPKGNERETLSLGDQATFSGGSSPLGDQSLGDQMTFGAGKVNSDDAVDDGMEVVDLSARYKIEKTLGKGGMGEVLLATDTRLGRKVAIKRILGEATRSRSARKRFLTGAKTLAGLSHPNIVQVYEYGQATDGPYMVLELISGGSLLDRCKQGAIQLEEAIDIACQLCDGLAKAHRAGVIHRDIKPGNILLTEDGIPKLNDFDLAKAESADTGMTMAGAVLGTLDFMPPEQRQDAALTDARSDLWSLAATLYQMVTGKSPKVIRLNDVPKALQEVLGKALEEDKEGRFQTAQDFKQALKHALTNAADFHVETGECPHCATRNDASRKFCKKCGKSMEVPCLGCNSKLPIWEEICGACGARQSGLVDRFKREMESQRFQAEQLLEESEFSRAYDLARRLGEQSDLRLGQLRGWSEMFLKQVRNIEREQLARVDELVSEALKHEQAADYLAAVHSLEQVPRAMFAAVATGKKEGVSEIFERVQAKQLECERLEQLIRDRISSRQLNGLLTEVERLLKLLPDKANLVKLKTQLSDRDAKLQDVRDQAYAAAINLAEQQNYEAALRELSRIDEYFLMNPQRELREDLETKVSEIRSLKEMIKKGIESKSYEGLLALVDQALWLRSQDSGLQSLRDQLLARATKNEAAVQAVVEKARILRGCGDFGGALQLLAKVSPEFASAESKALFEECTSLSELRNRAMDDLQRGITDSGFVEALCEGWKYRNLLADSGISDSEFVELLAKCQAAMAEHERVEAQARQFRLRVCISGVAACLLLFGLIRWRESERSWQARINGLLTIGNYAEVLRLDPENKFGLALKEKQEALARAIAADDFEEANRIAPNDTRVVLMRQKIERRREAHKKELSQLLEAGRYEEVLVIDPANPVAQAMKEKVAAKEAAINRALAAGDYEEVLSLDARNREGLALKVKAEAKNAAEATARALAVGDYEEVLRLDALMLPEEAISKLPAEALLKLPPAKNSIGLELKLLPAGVFTMGDPKGDGDQKSHQVTLARPFYLGVYEVTQEQYERVMGNNPSYFDGAHNPVEQVSWEDAMEFCRKLSALPEEQVAERVYRLPTEAEWEYACRAGSKTKYSFGENESQLGGYAWFYSISGNKTHPVGEKKPNAWGLYDVHGNVWEWCADWYGDYPTRSASEPVDVDKESVRVNRGGGWYNKASNCGAAARERPGPSGRGNYLGFRVALSLPDIRK